jgi:hypothetical protein
VKYLSKNNKSKLKELNECLNKLDPGGQGESVEEDFGQCFVGF